MSRESNYVIKEKKRVLTPDEIKELEKERLITSLLATYNRNKNVLVRISHYNLIKGKLGKHEIIKTLPAENRKEHACYIIKKL